MGARFLCEVSHILSCPACGLPLLRGDKAFTCALGHSFDRGKSGYVNLLLAHQKVSKDPGDSRDMMASRRAFLSKGHYARFSRALSSTAIAHLQGPGPFSILDAGCGEGYYLRALRQALNERGLEAHLLGIDISRAGVDYGARASANIDFAAASTFNLPVLAESLDCITRVFSPGDPAEFRRTLRPSGHLVVAVPGPNHLLGLKSLIYSVPELNREKEPVPDGFDPVHAERVAYTIELDDPADIANLFKMTPYYWHTTPQVQELVLGASRLRTEVDFRILVFRRR